jgi:hypothetical protein
LAHFLIVLTAAQNDAADVVAASTTNRGNNLLTIFFPLDPLDLPDVGFNARVLQLVDLTRGEQKNTKSR